jgi:hypothetical protein
MEEKLAEVLDSLNRVAKLLDMLIGRRVERIERKETAARKDREKRLACDARNEVREVYARQIDIDVASYFSPVIEGADERRHLSYVTRAVTDHLLGCSLSYWNVSGDNVPPAPLDQWKQATMEFDAQSYPWRGLQCSKKVRETLDIWLNRMATKNHRPRRASVGETKRQ